MSYPGHLFLRGILLLCKRYSQHILSPANCVVWLQRFIAELINIWENDSWLINTPLLICNKSYQLKGKNQSHYFLDTHYKDVFFPKEYSHVHLMNINFLQNSSLHIQHNYSSEVSNGRSTSEPSHLIWYEAVLLYFLMCSICLSLTLEMNFQSRKQENGARSGEHGEYWACTLLCFTKICYSKSMETAFWKYQELTLTHLHSSIDSKILLLHHRSFTAVHVFI